MASHEHLPAAGGSRLTAPTSALADARSIIGQHGVSLATVNATLNTRTSLIRPSGRGVYLRELDDPANLLQMLFKIPKGPGFRRIDPQHRGLQEMLDHIRTTCKVWIKVHENQDPDYILVFAEAETRLQDAFASLLRLLQLPDLDAEDKEQGMIAYLIYPPHDKDAVVVTAQPFSLNQHRFAAALVERESLSAAGRAQQVSEFLDEFKSMATILRRTPDNMQMRLNLGTVTLKQRPRRPEFHLEDLEKLMRSLRQRQTTDFDASIGDGNFGRALLDTIFECPEVFEGTETTDLALGHVTPQYGLTVITANLHLETEIVSELKGYSHAPVKVYRIGERSKRARINTFCPEKKFDWCLNIITESDAKIVPRALTNFVQNIKFNEVKPEAGFLAFPKVIFIKETAIQAQVTEVTGNSIWQFAIRETPYIMEVAIHHQWDPLNMRAEPVMSCGLSIFGQRWDQELTWTNTVVGERDWGNDFGQLFLDYEDQTGIESLLGLVDKIQDLIGSIPKSAD